MSNLVDLSIEAVGRQLRRGEVLSLELTEATLDQIGRTEPLIHAYAHVYHEAARAAARELDRERASGRWRGPLHGIPVAVKDLFYTLDAPTEAGSPALRGFMAPYEATAVTLLRKAGAVIVGKAVTHELAYGVNAPPTRSPWGEDSYPGGSSAGSGAALAARSAFGALGTDTGGSIREPAALNGVVGLKPTFGRVSRYGVVALSPSLDHAGPMARTVTDCALLLQAVAGFDPRDSGSLDEPVPNYLDGIDAGVRGLRIGVERRYSFGEGVAPEIRQTAEGVLDELEEAGAVIVDVSVPELDLAGPVALTILLADASAEHRHLLRDRGADLDPATRVMLELGELVPAPHYVQASRARSLVRDAVRRTFSAHGLDALASPTTPFTTMPMARLGDLDGTGQDPMTTAINLMFPVNATGQPALTIPCGFSTAGLPIGFQLAGRPFGEPTLFRIARAYERNHDWADRVPPAIERQAAHPRLESG